MESAPVGVGHRGGQSDRRVFAATDPELAHEDVGLGAHGQAFERTVVGLGRAEQAGGVAFLREIRVVVGREQIADRAPVVPEEAFARRAIADDAAAQGRQEGQQVVAAEALELAAELGRPGIGADLVAVDEDVVERLPCQRPQLVEHRLDPAVPMDVQGLAAELVALEPAAGKRGGVVGLARGGMPETHHRPVSGRGLPSQCPVRLHLPC